MQSTLAQAAALLVSESAIEAQTDRGDTLEIWTISHQDAVVSASAPRLAAPITFPNADLHTPRSEPHTITRS